MTRWRCRCRFAMSFYLPIIVCSPISSRSIFAASHAFLLIAPVVKSEQARSISAADNNRGFLRGLEADDLSLICPSL